MKKQLKSVVSPPRTLFVAFDAVRPIFVVTYAKFNLPQAVMDWADKIYEKTGNYDHDTFVVKQMEEPNNDNLQSFMDLFREFVADESMLSLYQDTINDINDRTSGILDRIYDGLIFNALSSYDIDYIKELFGNP